MAKIGRVYPKLLHAYDGFSNLDIHLRCDQTRPIRQTPSKNLYIGHAQNFPPVTLPIKLTEDNKQKTYLKTERHQFKLTKKTVNKL